MVGFGSEGPEFKSRLSVELISGGVNSTCHPSEVLKMSGSMLVYCLIGDPSRIVPNSQGDCLSSTNALHRVWSQSPLSEVSTSMVSEFTSVFKMTLGYKAAVIFTMSRGISSLTIPFYRSFCKYCILRGIVRICDLLWCGKAIVQDVARDITNKHEILISPAVMETMETAK